MAGDWLTAAEIAALALPGMPVSKRGVNLRAGEEKWPYRERAGRGGGREYHVSALPEAARVELGRRAVANVPTPAAPIPAKAEMKASTALTGRGKERLDAKLAVCIAFEKFHAASGQGVFAARQKFVGFYNAREIAVEPYVRAAHPTISVSSLERWTKARASGAVEKLAGQYGNRKGTGVLENSVRDIKGFLVATLTEKPHLSMEAARRLLAGRFGEEVELFDGSFRPLPSERRLQVVWQEWKDRNSQLHLALTNPDGWKNKHKVAVGSYSEGIDRPNQLWEIDASPADVMLTDGRHSIYVVVDVFTRRIMILVTRVPKSSAVLLLIRRAIIAWGMPEAIKTDNGSDFTSREAERAYFLLGVDHPTCTPYTPEQKPHVERAIGTVQHSLMPLLPGYTGHNVAVRQAIRASETFARRLGEKDTDIFQAALTGADLQLIADSWVEKVYLNSPHEGLGDRTPAEVAASSNTDIFFVTDERALDILLMPVPEGGTRTVSKKGIRVENATFYAHELIPFIGTGEELEVRLDPEDMGRVWVYRPEPFEFVCIAENPERRGLSRAELAAEAKALQQRFIAEGKAAIRAAKTKFKPHELADALIGKPLAPPTATITALPTAAPPPFLPAPASAPAATSAGLTAATRAIEASKPAQVAPRDDAQRARQADIARRIAAPVAPEEKPEDRWWRRAQAIHDAIVAGEDVSAEDQEWLAVAETTPWYIARKRAAERKAAFARAVE